MQPENNLTRNTMKKQILFLFIIFLWATSVLNANSVGIQSENSLNSVGFQNELKFISSELKIFPNPVTDDKFSVSSLKNIETIQLNNILGQKTEIELFKINEKAFKVTLKDKKQGIYLVTIIFEDKSKEVKRIVVN
jgi:hypothetical protein